jgi:hypothetical protein
MIAEMTRGVRSHRPFLLPEDVARFADWIIEVSDAPHPAVFELSTPKHLSFAAITDLLAKLPAEVENPILALELDYGLSLAALRRVLLGNAYTLDLGDWALHMKNVTRPKEERAFWQELDARLFRVGHSKVREEDFDFDAFQSGALSEYDNAGAQGVLRIAIEKLLPHARKHEALLGRLVP